VRLFFGQASPRLELIVNLGTWSHGSWSVATTGGPTRDKAPCGRYTRHGPGVRGSHVDARRRSAGPMYVRATKPLRFCVLPVDIFDNREILKGETHSPGNPGPGPSVLLCAVADEASQDVRSCLYRSPPSAGQVPNLHAHAQGCSTLPSTLCFAVKPVPPSHLFPARIL
jgi:hypothetical protein